MPAPSWPSRWQASPSPEDGLVRAPQDGLGLLFTLGAAVGAFTVGAADGARLVLGAPAGDAEAGTGLAAGDAVGEATIGVSRTVTVPPGCR